MVFNTLVHDHPILRFRLFLKSQQSNLKKYGIMI